MIRDKEQPKPSTSSALSKPPLTAEGNSEIKGSKVLAQETQTTYPSDIRLWSDIWAGNGGVNSVFGEKGYIAKLLANAKVVRFLAQNHREILSEFQKIAEIDRLAA